MNRFLTNLGNFRMVMLENHFPYHVVSLLYMPIVFVVLFLNCLRAQISWYIASFTLLSICMLIIGLILSIVFVACKGTSIYLSRNDMEEESDADEEAAETQPAFEGGSREILTKLLVDDLN
jgi:hypothetical protein